MKTHHRVENVRFEGGDLLLNIDGQERRFPLHKISTLLAKASDREKAAFEISPSGYGIYWPLLDEDISIDGLLGIAHSPERGGPHNHRLHADAQNGGRA